MAERRPQRKTQPPKKLEGFDVGQKTRKTGALQRPEIKEQEKPITEEGLSTSKKNQLDLKKKDSNNDDIFVNKNQDSMSPSQSNSQNPTTSTSNYIDGQEIEVSESQPKDQESLPSDNKAGMVSYQELVQHIFSNKISSVSYTSSSQNEPLLLFVCQKINRVPESCTADSLKALKQEISKFLSSFRKVYRQKKRRLEQVLNDNWSKRTLKIPTLVFKSKEEKEFSDSEKESELSKYSETEVESADSSYGEASEHFPSSEKEDCEEDIFSITRIELCSQMRSKEFHFTDTKNQLIHLREYILNKLPYSTEELEDFIPDLDDSIKQFLGKTIQMYKKANRTFDSLFSNLKPSDYLSKQFKLPATIVEFHTTTSYFREASKITPGGRKQLPFSEKSKRAQQYASAEIRRSHEPGAILLAAAQQPTELGRLVRKSNSVRGVTVKKALNAITKPTESQLLKKTPTQALAFLLCNNLSKEQYNQIKSACSESNANIWPNYNKLLQAKSDCRPENINIQSLCAKVPLQNLLDHTSKRILLHDPEVVKKLEDLSAQNNKDLELFLYFKYGLDGCGSFNSFMQKDETGKVPDGTTILASQLVPLQVVTSTPEKIIIFNSKNSNSASACRPIRICFERETKDSIQIESSRLMDEVKNLQTLILIEDPKVSITYKGLFTMIDGKVLNELTKNPASSSCPVCHQTSRQMSNPDGDFTPKPGTLEFGACILHFGLRSFEAICKIGYRQDVKKSHERLTEAEKKIISDREKTVKAEFKEKLGLIVDQRRDGGAGNTTTGNVARIALENAEVTAEICNVPVQLVKNLQTIWGTLASGFAIDGQKFAAICEATEKLYFDNVGWYNIPPTLHKILRHGKAIIENCALPIGLTNEEASEANNKILRHVRLHHARKTSWQDHLTDLYHRAMDVSDPVILEMASKNRKKHKLQKKPFSPEILALLQSPLLPVMDNEDDSSEDSDTS
jgi:hypothetical protein